jgi:uncharacterized protein YbaP (TraB family)
MTSLVLAVVLLSALGAGAAATESRTSGSQPAGRNGPLLWRVERSGATSYLFGTCHVPLDFEATLGEVGLDALDHSRRVFVELDLSSPMTVVGVLRATVTRMQMPDRSLRALLAPDLWDRLVNLHRGRTEADTLDHLKPWAVAFMTYGRLVERSRALHGPKPSSRGPHPTVVDMAVAERAKSHGIRVEELETPLDQVQVFNAERPAEGARMLEELLRHRTVPDEGPGVVDAYRAADDRRLEKEVGRLMRGHPLLAERLLTRRNEAWVSRLVLWLPDGGMFVAVGAAHMYGEHGLVALLRRRGYRVVPVGANRLPW